MSYLDDVLGRHDLLTVQALALTAMYSFRAEVSLKSGAALRTVCTNGAVRMALLSGWSNLLEPTSGVSIDPQASSRCSNEDLC